MKISMIAAVSKNGIIGKGLNIPWKAKGEQLIFKAITYNCCLLVGRKTFESMGKLPNRKFAILSKNQNMNDPDIKIYRTLDSAINKLKETENHLVVSGGGEIYKQTIHLVDTIHLSVIDLEIDGDIYFPEIPSNFEKVHSQLFSSNINYEYQIWKKKADNNI